VVLVDLAIPQVSVHAASRGVKDPACARGAHRLDHVVSEKRSLIEVDRRIGDGPGDVRVGGQMDDGVSAVHGGDQRREVEGVADDQPQPFVTGVPAQVPLPSGGEVVEDGETLGGGPLQQPVHEMAADEPGAADDADLAQAS
jgi:hypothetical protein